ncbi:helix-turn-helix domain-containing protein, partial [Candidatus Woesebacteria bacterium]|nr:helix-turn-helix domain-containing protein [Candidatus Woesebacteria bacterium]
MANKQEIVHTSGKLISIGRAAKILGVSVDTLRNWDNSGKLPSIRTSNKGMRKYQEEAIFKLANKSARHSSKNKKRMYKKPPVFITNDLPSDEKAVIQSASNSHEARTDTLLTNIITSFQLFHNRISPIEVWVGATIATFVVTVIIMINLIFNQARFEQWYAASFKPVTGPFHNLAQTALRNSSSPNVEQTQTDILGEADLFINKSQGYLTQAPSLVDLTSSKTPGNSFLLLDVIANDDIFVGDNLQVQGNTILQRAIFGTNEHKIILDNGTITSLSPLTFASQEGIVFSGNVEPTTGSKFDIGSSDKPFAHIYADAITVPSLEIDQSNISQTDSDAFTIDANNTAQQIALTFGANNNEKLYWNGSDTKFYFTDDVNINDSLAVGSSISADQFTDGTLYINDGTVDLGTNTLSDGQFTGNWDFDGGTLTDLGTISSGAITASGTSRFASLNLSGNISVAGTTNFNDITYTWPSADGSSGQALTTDGSGTLSWSSISGGASTLQGAYEGGSSVELSASEGDLRIYNDASQELLFLDEDTGFVGIGTTSPSYKLEVSGGDIYTSGDLRVAGDDIFLNTNTSGYVLVADGTNFNPVALSGDIAIDGTGATAIQSDSVALSTDTTGNYVATITAGNGISGASSTEGGTPTIALSDLTSDWSQGGAYDIVLANADSQLSILESAGDTYYGILDVGDLGANATYTLSGATG